MVIHKKKCDLSLGAGNPRTRKWPKLPVGKGCRRQRLFFGVLPASLPHAQICFFLFILFFYALLLKITYRCITPNEGNDNRGSWRGVSSLRYVFFLVFLYIYSTYLLRLPRHTKTPLPPPLTQMTTTTKCWGLETCHVSSPRYFYCFNAPPSPIPVSPITTSTHQHMTNRGSARHMYVSSSGILFYLYKFY